VVINREIGRYAVCTGASVLAGFARLPEPRQWALWLILVPQLLVAVASIVGLGGSAATALILVLPGDVRLWMVVSVVSASVLVLWGRYRGVKRVAMVLAVTLGVAGLAAAVSVGPDLGELSAGLVPRVPHDVD
jgi:Mn2+/Fe2+ NRAMP family transporter